MSKIIKLERAIRNQQFDIIQSIKVTDQNLKNYGLQQAALTGNMTIISHFLDLGADVKSNLSYCLTCAADNGHLEVIKILIAKGADPFAAETFLDENPACFAMSPLEIAALHGHFDCVKLFVELGLSMSIRSNEVIRAALAQGYISIAEYLLEHGANTDDYELTQYTSEPTRQFLLKRHASQYFEFRASI